LAVLGLIAGLTVPNVVASVENNKRISMGKNLKQAVSEFYNNAYLNGELEQYFEPFITGGVGYRWFSSLGGKNHPLVRLAMSRLNVLKACDPWEETQYCKTNDTDTYFKSDTKLIFQDGSVLTFRALKDDAKLIHMMIDYNGLTAGPNLTWDQQLDPQNATKSDRNYLFFNNSENIYNWNGFSCKPGQLCPNSEWISAVGIFNELK
jgi:hypothetical protein